jgi:hypothetical protein
VIETDHAVVDTVEDVHETNPRRAFARLRHRSVFPIVGPARYPKREYLLRGIGIQLNLLLERLF